MVVLSTTREIRRLPRGEAQQKVLGQKLADNAAARGTQRQPDADFTLSRHTARQQEIGDVRAADQQNETERKEQRRGHGERFERLLCGTALGHERDGRSAARLRSGLRQASVPNGEGRQCRLW